MAGGEFPAGARALPCRSPSLRSVSVPAAHQAGRCDEYGPSKLSRLTSSYWPPPVRWSDECRAGAASPETSSALIQACAADARSNDETKLIARETSASRSALQHQRRSIQPVRRDTALKPQAHRSGSATLWTRPGRDQRDARHGIAIKAERGA